ncbi:MAG: Ig-like domain-containing protein, partial [Acidimicrobiales bacterium]
MTGAGPGGGPHVRAFGGAGNEVASLFPYGSFTGGVYVASADVSGDGRADIITGAGAGGGPHVVVIDGATSNPLGSFFAYDAGFAGGVFVAAGDLDADGRADIITGAGAGGGPHVKVFSGATGDEISSFFAYAAGFSGGVRVAAADIDLDGRADIITGPGPGGGSHVMVFSGATGMVLASLFAYDAGFRGGVFVASGDLDLDGRADIITGAGAGGGPHVKVFSGLNGAQIRSLFAYPAGFSGGVFVGSADVNFDRRADIITGPGRGTAPILKVFDGATSAGIRSFFAYGAAFSGGVRVAGHLLSEPPAIAVTEGPPNGAMIEGNTPTYRGLAADSDGVVVRVEVNIDGGGFGTAGMSCIGCGTPNANWRFTPTPALTPGNHIFGFRARDDGNAVSPPVVLGVVVRSSPPTVEVTGGPPDGATIDDPTPTYTGNATDSDGAVAEVQVSIDGGQFGSAGAGCTGCGTASATWSFTPAAPLTSGPHTVSFRSKDNGGNESEAVTRGVTITMAPTIVITGGPPDASTT